MRNAALLALAVVALSLLACAEPLDPQSQQASDRLGLPPLPSVLLVTVEGLRADAVAGLRERPPRQSFTPNLDQLISEASWAGRAVAASGSSAPAVASILTGLLSWSHQVLSDQQPLSRQAHTLAEALQERGYATTAYVTGRWLPAGRGFQQGFDAFRAYGGGGRARGQIAALGDQPQLVWIHFTEPEPPYRLPDSLATKSRRRISRQELEIYRDPAVDLPEEKRREIWRAYLQHVLLLDHRLGGLLTALRSSGADERTMVVVAAVHGEEFGEHGQIGHGNNLGRVILDVPLIIRLPGGEKAPMAIDKAARPSILRLWSTILESAGGDPAPALPPSFFHEAREGALSELFGEDGRREFSWVEGNVQLIREIASADRKAPPFSGDTSLSGGSARTTLWAWEGRGARELHRQGSKMRFEERLALEWSRFLDRERTPEEEQRYRNED